MHPRRLVRINELIHQTLSEVALGLKDPHAGFITITGTETSADVSLVKVFYTVLGGQAEKEATAEVLERARPHFRRSLARLENLKKVHDIAFHYDPGTERADRVNRLLHDLAQEEKPDGSGSQD